METPAIKEKYDGIRGRIQGEKKESSPAMKAAVISTSSNIEQPLSVKALAG
jgi:hypothetical protein